MDQRRLYAKVERSKDWVTVPDYNFKEIIYEKRYFDNGGVARVTFNRPERLNSLTNIGWEELVDALEDADLDPTS